MQKWKSTDAFSVAGTPDCKQRKSLTPLTVTSKSTTKSKRAVSLMISLALKTLPKKVNCKQDAASKASLSDAVDLNHASMIDLTYKKGLRATIEHHF